MQRNGSGSRVSRCSSVTKSTAEEFDRAALVLVATGAGPGDASLTDASAMDKVNSCGCWKFSCWKLD